MNDDQMRTPPAFLPEAEYRLRVLRLARSYTNGVIYESVENNMEALERGIPIAIAALRKCGIYPEHVQHLIHSTSDLLDSREDLIAQIRVAAFASDDQEE
jgi:hypothetical protein